MWAKLLFAVVFKQALQELPFYFNVALACLVLRL